MGVALGALAIGGMVLGGAQKAHTIRQQGKVNEAIANRNAQVARIRSEEARRRGEEMANRRRTRGRQVRGAQRAALAAQGITVDVGTGLDIQEDTERLTEEDVTTIRNNAALEAWGYEVEAQDATFEGKLAKFNRRQAVAGSILGSVTGGLGAFS